VIGVSASVLFIAFVAFFSALVYLPVFMQVVQDSGATSSGLLLVPMMAGVIVSTVISGRLITKTGRYKIYPVLGLAVAPIALFLFSTMTVSTSLVTTGAYMVIFGLGFGTLSPVLILAVQNAVDRRDLGTASASVNFFQSMGGSIGVAVFGALLNARLTTNLATELPPGVRVNTDAHQLLSSPERIRALPPDVHNAVVSSVEQGLQTVFLVAAGLAVVGFLILLLLKELPLKTAPAHGGGAPGGPGGPGGPGMAPQGASPNGASPNGAAPNGATSNGAVPADAAAPTGQPGPTT
jgi:MFS family permease